MELDGQGRYATPPLYSSSDFIPIFTQAFSVYYYMQGKLSLKKNGGKKDGSEIYTAIDVFAEEIKSGLYTWCKAGFTLLLNLSRANKVRMGLLLQINHCFINEGKCSAVHMGREIILPLLSRVPGGIPERRWPCSPSWIALVSFADLSPVHPLLAVKSTCKRLS